MSARLRSRRLWLTVPEFCAATGWTAWRTWRALREGRLRGRDLNTGTGRRPRWQVLASEVQRAGGGES